MFKIKINKKNEFFRVISFIPFFVLFYSSIQAHEMWIEPINYSINVGDIVEAHEMVGQNFKGNKYAYLDSSFDNIKIATESKTKLINSRLGDLPAIQEKSLGSGLHIITAETTLSELSYESFEKFEVFLEAEGLEWVKGEHKKKGFADKGFKEVYRRNAKALVKVGDGKGNDKVQGLPLEWVALTNPYDSEGDMVVKLLWQGEPAVDMHVNIFNKPKTIALTPKLLKTTLRTNANGIIEIPRVEGVFLINSVKMIPAGKVLKNEKGVIWESIWGSLTYAIE